MSALHKENLGHFVFAKKLFFIVAGEIVISQGGKMRIVQREAGTVCNVVNARLKKC
jgi:hypothetical protein